MTTTELLETVRRVEVRTNRCVNELTADSSWRSLAQFRRNPRAMKDGKNRNRAVLDGKIDGGWQSLARGRVGCE